MEPKPGALGVSVDPARCVWSIHAPSPADGSARTWWREQIDKSALTDDALEAVQNSAAVQDGLAPALLAPGKLDGLDWKNGVKVADLISYFDEYVLTIDHPEEGQSERSRAARKPRCWKQLSPPSSRALCG